MIEKMNLHYSFTNPASVHDEEALTALELAGRQGAKINELIDSQNALITETDNRLEKQDAYNAETRNKHLPAEVDREMQHQINAGVFDDKINEYAGNLTERVDNLIEHTTEGSTTFDNEIIDARTSAFDNTYGSLGAALRGQFKGLTTPYTNIEPLLKHVRTQYNGCTETSASVLKKAGTSTTNYGAIMNRYVVPGDVRKLLFVQQTIITSGEMASRPGAYCYNAEGANIGLCNDIYTWAYTSGGIDYYILAVELKDGTRDVEHMSYKMKASGVVEIGDMVIMDVTHLSNDRITEYCDLLKSEYMVENFGNWGGCLPISARHAIDADNANHALHADNSVIGDYACSASTISAPKRIKVKEVQGFGGDITFDGETVTFTNTVNYTGVSLHFPIKAGYTYLIIWRGKRCAECATIKPGGSAYDAQSITGYITVNGVEYNYGYVTPTEEASLDRVIIQRNVNVGDTLYDITYSPLHPGVGVTTDLVRDTIIQKAYYAIPANNYWSGKNVLFIGDSLTAAHQYQDTVKAILGINIHNHCKGGLTLKTMVDGNGDDFEALSASHVRDMDLIVLYGGYNNRYDMAGNPGDNYNDSGSNTIAGYMKHALERVFTALTNANNLACRVLTVTVDCVGKSAYNNADGYTEFPEGSGQTMETIANVQKAVSANFGVPCCDLYHNSGINRHTWNVFSVDSAPTLETPKIPDAAYPYNGDQLHKNAAGYQRIGECIAGAIINAYGK